jgi:hypothetical protein
MILKFFGRTMVLIQGHMIARQAFENFSH